MAIDPHKALHAQFSQFIAEELSVDEWRMITRESGTADIAADVDRFYRSKRFADDDETRRTIRFLERVQEENEEIAYGIMKRAYDMAGGADANESSLYPALTLLEDENLSSSLISLPALSIRSEPFIDINNVFGTFYPELISQINQSHRIDLNEATLVLTRKLLENLIIDILRETYDGQQTTLYYDPDNKRFQPFYTLVDNFSANLDDFERYSDALDSDFIDELNDFRQTANSGAHSLETTISDEEITTYGDKAEYLTKVLLRVKESL